MFLNCFHNLNSRCLQGLTQKDIDKLIADILKIRQYQNKHKSGRGYVKLSKNAKEVIAKNKQDWDIIFCSYVTPYTDVRNGV